MVHESAVGRQPDRAIRTLGDREHRTLRQLVFIPDVRQLPDRAIRIQRERRHADDQQQTTEPYPPSPKNLVLSHAQPTSLRVAHPDAYHQIACQVPTSIAHGPRAPASHRTTRATMSHSRPRSVTSDAEPDEEDSRGADYSGSGPQTLFRPCALARYNASSARPTSTSGCRTVSGTRTDMPMLIVT